MHWYFLLRDSANIGVSVGILAAAIDIVSDWLGDLKEGFCKPTFYLNRGFCCWGISGTSPSEMSLSKMTRNSVRIGTLGALRCIYRLRPADTLSHICSSRFLRFVPLRYDSQ
jgi:hypothetical protein